MGNIGEALAIENVCFSFKVFTARLFNAYCN